jgi:hypothetical protein
MARNVLMHEGMPTSAEHDGLVELFRDNPKFAGELLALLAPEVKLSKRRLGAAAVASQSFEQINPTTYSADLVVTFGKRPSLAVIVEVQRRRSNAKRRSWPLYVAHLWARYGCPVFILVLAPSNHVGDWCGKPILLGHPGFVLQPLVAGPRSIAPIRSADKAMRNPELAVVSAIVHAADSDALQLALVAAKAVLSRKPDTGYLYYDLIAKALRSEDAKILEDTMTQKHQFASPMLRRAYSRGINQTRVEDILTVLTERGLEVTTELEERIRSCRDAATHARMLRLAVTASSADELLAKGE